MTNSELILRRVFGVSRANIRPLSTAADVVGELLFEYGYSMNDILVTKHVYPETAKRLGKNTGAISKSIERLSRICWDAMVEQNLVTLFIGRVQRYAPTPRDLLVYFAVYAHLGRSFFELAEEYPELLFRSPTEIKFLSVNTGWAERPEFTIGEDAPLLLIYRLAEGYSITPVCQNCMAVLEQDRLSICSTCGKCGDVDIVRAQSSKNKV